MHPFVIGSTGTMMFASARTLESLGVGRANGAVVLEVLKDLALSSAEKAFDVTTISKPEVSVGWTQPREGPPDCDGGPGSPPQEQPSGTGPDTAPPQRMPPRRRPPPSDEAGTDNTPDPPPQFSATGRRIIPTQRALQRTVGEIGCEPGTTAHRPYKCIRLMLTLRSGQVMAAEPVHIRKRIQIQAHDPDSLGI